MEDEVSNRMEALLIATVTPLAKNEISTALSVDLKTVEKSLRLLKKRYNDTSLELKIMGRKYKIGVRDKYSEVAFKYSESEIDKGELEIIGLLFRKGRTYISHVERLRGRKAEEELDHLSKLGLVEIVPKGRRRLVKLTRTFFSKYGKQLKERIKVEGVPIVPGPQEDPNQEDKVTG
ncbi:MAG: SMC-Scp complex subunit ScpB [Thermoplasmatales archaeon]|nr:SMC-Scp complex subunit ScpB [Thermoplasmatales archaeon]